MVRQLRNIALGALFLAAAGCGNQDAPSNVPTPAASIPDTSGSGQEGGTKTCSAPLKSCPGGAVPTLDTKTCNQTCPGE